ncbi:uncharacterized protein V2V93DRAFT_367266 [Kockiozyma suomiensis]|uniref:uncharacterized protein n=1 Tax=Kockiozyma suomiensis TaxID=1337062 RepID=UPI003343D735
MKFFVPTLLTLVAGAMASIEVVLRSVSTDLAISGLYVDTHKEVTGTSWLFLSEQGNIQTFYHETGNNTFHTDVAADAVYYLHVSGNNVVFTTKASDEFGIVPYLTYNGFDSYFYACSGIVDPKDYNDLQYLIMYYEVGEIVPAGCSATYINVLLP